MPSAVEKSSLADRVRAATDKGLVSLPPLPEAAMRIEALLRDEEKADSRQIAALIEKEPALAAAMLRLANSATFGGLHAVVDPADAVSRLGLKQVRTLVTTVAHHGHYDCQDPRCLTLQRKLWDHAVAAAVLCRHIARLVAAEPAEAFLAGLLHDVGKLVVLKAIPVVEGGQHPITCTEPVLLELMDVMHAELGHQVLTQWHISGGVAEAALKHHSEEAVDGRSLTGIVEAANTITRQMGHHLHPTPELVLIEMPEIERLGLSELELASMLVDAEDEIDEVLRSF